MWLVYARILVPRAQPVRREAAPGAG
jgi:hypothetical protein